MMQKKSNASKNPIQSPPPVYQRNTQRRRRQVVPGASRFSFETKAKTLFCSSLAQVLPLVSPSLSLERERRSEVKNGLKGGLDESV